MLKKNLTAVLACAWIMHAASGAALASASSTPQINNGTATQAQGFPSDPRRHIWFRNLLALPEDIKTAGLHIEVMNAPDMSLRLHSVFEQAGYNMVSADQAKYRYMLTGSFASDGKVKTQLPIGDILKGLAPQDSSQANASLIKRAGDVAASAIIAEQAVSSGLLTPLWASGDVLNALASATGVRDTFNKALTGDRRGACLVGCTYWEWSDQGVGLSWFDPRQKRPTEFSSVNVGIFAQGVYPDELMTLAFNEFLRHHGVVDTPEPSTPAMMPPRQVMDVTKSRIPKTRALLENQ